jgi:hypothetical protein
MTLEFLACQLLFTFHVSLFTGPRSGLSQFSTLAASLHSWGSINEVAIADVDYAITLCSQVLIVGHHHKGFLLLSHQPCQEFHNRFPVLRIEVAGWFISIDNGRIINQGSGDCDSLLAQEA